MKTQFNDKTNGNLTKQLFTVWFKSNNLHGYKIKFVFFKTPLW